MHWRSKLNPEGYSLRQRLALGMATTILPLLLISFSGYFMLQYAVSVMEQSHEEIQHEMMPVIRLQALMLQAQMPPNDFLIHADSEEIHKFNAMVRDITTRLQQLTQAPFEMDGKRERLGMAHQEWMRAEHLAGEIFALSEPIGNPVGAELMRRFDATALRAHQHLDYITVLSLGEVNAQHQLVHGVNRGAGIALAMFLLAVTLAVLIGSLLVQRWIVAPLGVLRRGAERFGEGKLDYRIPVHTSDEIGQVAETFNTMAESLMRDRDILISLALHDQLTGLLNHKAFRQQFELEIVRAQRHGHDVGLLMIDIDYFKRVNDSHGHLAGDAVLREIADRIRSTMRPNDIPARYGGEEFIAVLAETGADGAQAMAERLCESVRSRPFKLNYPEEVSITISIGVAVFPADAAEADSLIEAADQALYAAKNAGRDRVVMHVEAGSYSEVAG